VPVETLYKQRIAIASSLLSAVSSPHVRARFNIARSTRAWFHLSSGAVEFCDPERAVILDHCLRARSAHRRAL
jgi:hypothetical protein